jgi:hypothetical protein
LQEELGFLARQLVYLGHVCPWSKYLSRQRWPGSHGSTCIIPCTAFDNSMVRPNSRRCDR